MPELTRLISTGTVPLLSSEVPTSEDAKTGATLAVFSVQENHIVNSTSRQWVSGPFWVNIQGAPFEFKVKFTAKQVAEAKRGLSFKKANGWGKMELKCAGEPVEGDRFKVAFLVGPGVKQYSLNATAATTDETVSMGETGDPAKKIDRRETQSSHDFGKYPLLGLPAEYEMWDFGSLQDKKKQLIHIGVEMLPQKSASEHKPHEEKLNENIESTSTITLDKKDDNSDNILSCSTRAPDDVEFEEMEFLASEERKKATLQGKVMDGPPGLKLP
mmetsp:Transcript_56183/g.111661  ORF Transcript_56183/g.111661 Transcript_56183/m.111661 type:complete len:272 (-) Transcript_56183:75-890(-)